MTPAEQMREAVLAEIASHEKADTFKHHGTAFRALRYAISALPLPPEPPVDAMAAALRAFVTGYECEDDGVISAYHAAASALAEYDACRAGR